MAKTANSSERIEFYFPGRVSKMLRDLVPPRERSRFVAEATEKELKRRIFNERLVEFAKLKTDTYQAGKKPRWNAVRTLP